MYNLLNHQEWVLSAVVAHVKVKKKDGGRWMRKECKDKSDESEGPLTVEGLGAHLAVSFGHSTATTRRSGRVTLHALHRLACTSGRQRRNTLWKTPALINTKSAKIAAIYIYRNIRIAGWPALGEISLRFGTYGPAREREREWEGEWKKKSGGRVQGTRREAGAKNPWQSKQLWTEPLCARGSWPAPPSTYWVSDSLVWQ